MNWTRSIEAANSSYLQAKNELKSSSTAKLYLQIYYDDITDSDRETHEYTVEEAFYALHLLHYMQDEKDDFFEQKFILEYGFLLNQIMDRALIPRDYRGYICANAIGLCARQSQLMEDLLSNEIDGFLNEGVDIESSDLYIVGTAFRCLLFRLEQEKLLYASEGYFLNDTHKNWINNAKQVVGMNAKLPWAKGITPYEFGTQLNKQLVKTLTNSYDLLISY